MTELLPSLQAEEIRRGLVDYLATTFALADAEPRQALSEFLDDPVDGIFKGPYLRIRMPFRPADDGWSDLLDWTPPFPPYRHQAQAYARLTSKNLGPDRPRPLPTIVTTGTGSGKTEAFLHPVIDHCLRARAAGQRGTKALLLYPMNALADDQALRLTRLLTEDPALTHLTAGIYTGDAREGQAGEGRTKVTPEGLITNRRVLRDDPPDILLTNYKMLDQLLLRPEDRGIWERSAASLTYLVLDEFHTYDGAQGTDVALLLRRLGIVLRSHIPDDHPEAHLYRERPLGRLTPVATSATLGDSGDPTEILAFAEQIFGETFERNAAIGEARLGLDELVAPAPEQAAPRTAAMLLADVEDLAGLGRAHRGDGTRLVGEVVARLYGPAAPGTADGALLAHPDVRALIDTAREAVHVDTLAQQTFPAAVVADHPGLAREAVATIVAALSHIRFGDRSRPSVETTMWVREVTRIDRLVSSEPGFRWDDDGEIAITPDGPPVASLPALYCRACGRSGWGVLLAPTGRDLAERDEKIRGAHAAGQPRFRALIHAPGEAAALAATDAPFEPTTTTLRWLHLGQRTVLPRPPADDDPDALEGRVLPVLMLDGDSDDIESRSTHDECPSCGRRDQIRFLGSSIATLLSVSLTTLFGDRHLDPGEKRALVFTDSVQDAAHRAGFIDHRSHAMSLRAALRAAVAEATTLDALVETTMRQAEDDGFARYRLVPAALAHHDDFEPYWTTRDYRRVPARAIRAVRRRLAFDAALQVGLQSLVGRTLESTGSLGVHVAAHPRHLLDAAREALADTTTGQLPLELTTIDDTRLVAWTRGVLEHLRRDGAITHDWLTKYVQAEGARIWIWGKRRRNEGMPAFPSRRAAPAFAIVGGKPGPKSAFVPATSAKSWYALWAARSLGISAGHGASASGRLLASLARSGVLVQTPTENGGRAYGIAPESVTVTPLTREDLTDGRALLVCDTCRTPLPTSPDIVDQLDGSRCPMVRCPGSMTRQPIDPENFYRRLFETADMRRVDAREHTSLLDGGERRAIEEGFKRARQDPGDPNVLVATPTLEMGIDIGDLTTVMLSSLPDSVAKYTQRVGRAGRLTGSALALAFVTGRGEQLPRLGAPESMLNGAVRPPATYLDAEEILRRQFIAFVIDSLVRTGYDAMPRLAGAALDSAEPGTLLGDVIATVAEDPRRWVERFTMAGVSQQAQSALASWVAPDAPQGVDPGSPQSGTLEERLPAALRGQDSLAATIHRAVQEHRADLEALHRQKLEIEQSLPDLRERAALAGATEDDRTAVRTAEGGLKVLHRLITEITQDGWIAGLERRGLLPNYSLFDDTVELQAQVSWMNPETQSFVWDPVIVGRGAANALTELAPGAHFYAHGLDMQVQGVELGRDDTDLRHQALCDRCGYVHELAGPTSPSPTTCTRCGSTGIADTGQRLDVLRLSRVFSDLSRDDARIDDSAEDRHRTRFEVLTAVDFDPARREGTWSVPGTGFGVAHYRRLTIRWINLGLDSPMPARHVLAGREAKALGFRVCEACGKLDSDAGRSSAREHRAWCRHRQSLTEHTRTLALGRELVTQAVAITLPPQVTGDMRGTASLEAAVLLGLRETMGGSPDHLRVLCAPHPVDGGGGQAQEALVLHDTVPGGTGYLTDLARPERLWAVLVRAAAILQDCPCRDEGRTSCYRCLLPFARDAASVDRDEALRALRTLLEADDGSVAGLDEHTCRWQTVNTAPANEGLSPLELRFRERLEGELSAHTRVTRTPGPRGLELRIAGGDGHQWNLAPQVDVAGCRPDFVLRADGGLPDVAIFTDGYTYHASPAHNRLADDARKRARLRASGYVVLAATDADLGVPQLPAWFDDLTLKLLMGQPGSGLTTTVIDEQSAGPLGLLNGLVRQGDDPARRRLADITGILAFLKGQQRTLVSADAPLTAVAVALLGDEPLPHGDQTILWHRRAHLTMAVRAVDLAVREVVVVLDDSPEAVAQPDFKDAWREWLQISNLLALATVPVAVHTRTTVADDTPGSTLSPVEGHVARALWDGVDADELDTDVIAIAAALHAGGAPRPQVGSELDTGSIAELAWPALRVALVHADMADDEVRDLTRAGWRVHRALPGIDTALLADLDTEGTV